MAKEKEAGKDILENPEALQEKVLGIEHWIESNPKIVFGVVGALLLVVAGYFGYRYYIGNQDAQAQKEMFQAIRYFEKYIDSGNDSLNVALKGDGNNLGFVDIMEDYSLTKAGKLANFYAQRTLTKAPITLADQAEVAYLLSTSKFSKTTGQIISVDGGLQEAFLR